MDIAAIICDLTVHDPESSYINPSVRVLNDRVVSTAGIAPETVLLICYPVLSYDCRRGEGNVPLLCGLKKRGNSFDLAERLSGLYPRLRGEMIECFKRYSPTANPTDLLVSRHNHVDIKCHHNAIRTEDRRYLYLEASKINHSCLPNCTWTVGEEGDMRVTASRPLRAGEELTIDYLDKWQVETRLERRNELIKLGFYCGCEACNGRCHTCDRPHGDLKLCGRCRIVPYCSLACQREDWPRHKSLEHFIHSSK